jgi:cystathionine beta-lyase/cystathionine gamma-synthase
MGAISSAILHYIKHGDHVIASNNLYNPTMNFLTKELKKKANISTTIVEGDKIEDFENAIQPNTSLIYLECPSTAVFKMQDIQAVVALAKKHNIKTVIDNTWATPLFQRCIEMGIDLEVHSLSKYLNGHSDVVGGCILGSKKDIEEIRNNELALYGAKLAPFEAFLVIRGLRTLSARLAVHAKNAKAVVEFLDNHPKISKVHHPLSKSYPQQELAKRQLLDYTALLSFEIDAKQVEDIKKFMNHLNLFKIGVSWGGHESLVFAPNIAILNEMTLEQAKMLNVSPYTIRVSLGLENSEDLIQDLANALENI